MVWNVNDEVFLFFFFLVSVPFIPFYCVAFEKRVAKKRFPIELLF
jgi:hypothetical protein